LRQLGRLAEAEEVYRKAAERFRDSPVPLNGLAETLRQLGRLAEAEEVYRKAAERFPHDAYARNGLASVLLARRAFAEVRTLLERPAYVTDQDWVAYHILAMSYLREGNAARAKAMFQYGLPLCPLSSRGYFRTALSVADLALGEYQSALDNVVVVDFRGPAAVAVRDLIHIHALSGLKRGRDALAVRDKLRLTDDVQRRLLADIDRRFGLTQPAATGTTLVAELNAAIQRREEDLLMDALRAA
jgi:tetratricopeptide (TPR) repeat protein